MFFETDHVKVAYRPYQSTLCKKFHKNRGSCRPARSRVAAKGKSPEKLGVFGGQGRVWGQIFGGIDFFGGIVP